MWFFMVDNMFNKIYIIHMGLLSNEEKCVVQIDLK